MYYFIKDHCGESDISNFRDISEIYNNFKFRIIRVNTTQCYHYLIQVNNFLYLMLESSIAAVTYCGILKMHWLIVYIERDYHNNYAYNQLIYFHTTSNSLLQCVFSKIVWWEKFYSTILCKVVVTSSYLLTGVCYIR